MILGLGDHLLSVGICRCPLVLAVGSACDLNPAPPLTVGVLACQPCGLVTLQMEVAHLIQVRSGSPDGVRGRPPRPLTWCAPSTDVRQRPPLSNGLAVNLAVSLAGSALEHDMSDPRVKRSGRSLHGRLPAFVIHQ